MILSFLGVFLLCVCGNSSMKFGVILFYLFFLLKVLLSDLGFETLNN